MHASKIVVLRNAAWRSEGRKEAKGTREKGGRSERGVETTGRDRIEEKSPRSFTQHKRLRKKPTYVDVDMAANSLTKDEIKMQVEEEVNKMVIGKIARRGRRERGG
jgi:hypothetical protein